MCRRRIEFTPLPANYYGIWRLGAEELSAGDFTAPSLGAEAYVGAVDQTRRSHTFVGSRGLDTSADPQM